MRIAQSVLELIGGTPLVELNRLRSLLGFGGRIAAKLESRNPMASAKDRIALSMVEAAEAAGELKPGGAVIEATSGNTGIGLSMVCAVKGYRMILVMPETMSIERRKLAAQLGAEIVLTPGAEGMQGAVDRARELQSTIPNSIIAGQFENPANPEAHERTTGQEIWTDTDGQVDVLVASVGTGGTLTGAGRALKARKPQIRVVAVEPAASPLLSEGWAGPHQIQGIGANFVPETLDRSLIDRIVAVTDEEAFEAARLLAGREGILAGISSGAALHAAVRIASEPENAGKLIVVVLPDTGERYLSTALYR